jgi:tellurite resistance protein
MKMSKFATALVAAAATLAVATPSFAVETKAKIIQRNGETLYCVKASESTGSRVPQKVCRTQAEWAASGAQVKPKAEGERLAANPQPVKQN